MKENADFSVDTDKFPDLPTFADSLKDKSMRLVVILDPGLSAVDTSNKYYKRAQELKTLIKSTVNTD